MEILFELLFEFLWLLAEAALQILFEWGFGYLLRSAGDLFKEDRPVSRLLVSMGYVALGIVAGHISLRLFPNYLIRSTAGQWLNLLATPVLAGLAMAATGKWRIRKNQELIHMDRFTYGFLFALTMAIVRFKFAH